jgi:hypothetical protein
MALEGRVLKIRCSLCKIVNQTIYGTSTGLAGNVYVYDGLGFRSASLSHVLNEIKKTKLQTYTEPQAGINILLAAVATHQSLFI